jgi:SAM-dependent methyltransferase
MAETEHATDRAGRNADGDGAAEFFEAMYQGASKGELTLPWQRPAAHPLLVDWADRRGVTGGGRRAVIVGCGTGVDAEYVSGLGFETTGFDVSQTAIDLAMRQHLGSTVTYTTADLLNLPADWHQAFDLAVEIYTVQALPDPPRAAAIAGIAQLVAPGGTLLAIAFVGDQYKTGGFPPWPLTRAEVDSFGADGLEPVAIETLTYSGSPQPQSPDDRLWRAEFRRPAA